MPCTGVKISTRFMPNEIKTFKINNNKIIEVTLLEEEKAN